MTSFVTIGRITAPHGVRGEVRVLPMTDFPERFDGLERVFVSADGRARAVEALRWHKQFVLMKLEGVDNRDEADKLRRAFVQVPEDEAHPLPPDTYYVFQLIGLDVFTREGRKLGVVADVLQTGANDVYVVVPEEGGREVLVPAVRHVVLDIDVEGRRIEVQLLPGLE